MKCYSILCSFLLILLMAVFHVSGHTHRHRLVSESDILAQLVLMMATGQNSDIAQAAGKVYCTA